MCPKGMPPRARALGMPWGPKKWGTRGHAPHILNFQIFLEFCFLQKKISILVGSVGKQYGSDPLPTLCVALLAHCLPLHFPTILPHNT